MHNDDWEGWEKITVTWLELRGENPNHKHRERAAVCVKNEMYLLREPKVAIRNSISAKKNHDQVEQRFYGQCITKKNTETAHVKNN